MLTAAEAVTQVFSQPLSASEWCCKCDVSRTDLREILNQLFLTSKIPHAGNRNGMPSMPSFFSTLKSE